MKGLLKTIIIMFFSVSCLQISNGCSQSNGKIQTADTIAKTEISKETQKISYYSFSEWTGDTKYSPAYKEVVDRFEKENPGFAVELQYDPWGTWEPKYRTMFVSGNVPDVFITNNPDFPVFADNDDLLDIGAVAGEDYFKDFFQGVLKMYTWKGKVMGIPLTTDAWILWYNKEIFKKVGLDTEKPPNTWAELKEYAKKCTIDTNGDGKVDVYGYGIDLGLKEFPQQALFCASDGTIIKVGNDGSITPNVNTPEFKGYLQLLTDMKPYYEPDFVVLDHHKVGTLFAQQKVAMVIGGTWVKDMNKNMETDTFYGQALVPKMYENAPNGSFGGGFAICVNKNTKHPKEAVKFAQMLCTPENNYRLMSDIPASNGGLAASPMIKDPKFSIFMKQLASARQAQPKTLFYPKIDSATYNVVVKVILGEYSVEQGIAELESNIKMIVH